MGKLHSQGLPFCYLFTCVCAIFYLDITPIIIHHTCYLYIHIYICVVHYIYIYHYILMCALFWSNRLRRVCRHGWHGLRQEIEELDLSHIDAFAYVPCHRLGDA